MLANLPHLTPLASDLTSVAVVTVFVLAVLKGPRLWNRLVSGS